MAGQITIPLELRRTLAEGTEGPDVQAVKAMLNLVTKSALDPRQPRYDAATAAAARVFQLQEKLGVDGKVGPRGTYPRLLRAYRYHWQLGYGAGTPPWLKTAYGEIGQAQVVGEAHNPRIVEYLNTCPSLKKAHTETRQVPRLDSKGKPRMKDGKPLLRTVWDTDSPLKADVDETAWCAAFVNWCLRQSGLTGLDNAGAAAAASWLEFGAELTTPRYGAITVIYNASMAQTSLTASGNHVGFLLDGGLGNSVTLLGGNQGRRVKISTFSGWEIKGFRWPVTA